MSHKTLQVHVARRKLLSKVVVHDYRLCTGCKQCMIACAYRHSKSFDFRFSMIVVEEFTEGEESYFTAATCMHCPTPFCAEACPNNALLKGEDGVVRVDGIRCKGCSLCQYACPLSHPKLHPVQGYAMKCDLCDGEPRCVEMCSSGALKFIEVEKLVDLEDMFHV